MKKLRPLRAREILPEDLLGEGYLIAIAHGHRLGVQPAQQRAILRHKLDVPALRALQHDVATGRAVGKECKLGERVAIELVMATEALHSSRAGRGLFLRLRRIGAADFFYSAFFDTHTSFPSKDSIAE